jgi:hypothetical protein
MFDETVVCKLSWIQSGILCVRDTEDLDTFMYLSSSFFIYHICLFSLSTFLVGFLLVKHVCSLMIWVERIGSNVKIVLVLYDHS